MPKFKSSVTTEEVSKLTVIWEDDAGNVIVAGEKLVKGGPKAAQRVAAAFAKDLRHNFADRFPPEPTPPPEEGMI